LTSDVKVANEWLVIAHVITVGSSHMLLLICWFIFWPCHSPAVVAFLALTSVIISFASAYFALCTLYWFHFWSTSDVAWLLAGDWWKTLQYSDRTVCL